MNQQGSATPYLIVQPDGKVGIGVANPSEALDVSGNMQFSGALMPGGNAGTAGFVLMSQGAGNSPVWVDTALLGDKWGGQVAQTQGPLVGDGTSANPIGLQSGANAGDVLIWNGSQWTIKPSPFDSVCNSAMANYVMKWTGSELCNSIIYDNGSQIGIGTNTPDPSAILELNSPNAGFLPPRVTLASFTDVTTISSPAIGLLVYHTGIPGMPAGFYYWDGGRWKKLESEEIVVYEDIITPVELNSGAYFVELPSAVDSNDNFIRFENGSSGFLFWYQLIPPGILPDSVNYIIEVSLLKRALADDLGGNDNDLSLYLSDSILGFGFILPDYTPSGCCQGYGLLRLSLNPLGSSLISGSLGLSSGPGVDYGTMVIEMNDTSTYLALVSDRLSSDLRYRASVRSRDILHPSNGLYLVAVRGDLRENYEIRFIRVRVVLKQY